MKKQIKRFSKSTLAVVLSLCILMSCAVIAVGAVDTAPANVFSAKAGAVASVGAKAGSDAVGAIVDSDSVGYNNWCFLGDGVSWSARDNDWHTSSNGEVTYDLTDYVGHDIYFRFTCDGTSCGPSTNNTRFGTAGTIVSGTSKSMSWNNTNNFIYQVVGGWVTFKVNDMSVTIYDAYPTYNLYNGTTNLGSMTKSGTGKSAYWTKSVSMTYGTNVNLCVKSTLSNTTTPYMCSSATITPSSTNNDVGHDIYRYDAGATNTDYIVTTPDVTGSYTVKFQRKKDSTSNVSNNAYLTVTYPTQSVSVSAGTGGTVSTSSVSARHSKGVSVTATANDGYTFNKWTATSPASVSSTTSATTTVTTTASGGSVAASFTKNSYTVKKTESGTSGGTVKVGSTTITTGGVSIEHGSYTVTVTAPTGYNVSAVSGISGTTSGLNTGSVTITGVSINAAKTIAVTYVNAGTCGFTLSKSSTTLNIGGTDTFTATPNSYHSSGTISAASSDTSVATVSKSGNTYTVTAVAPGTATITVSCTDTGNTASTFSVTVNSPSVSTFSYSTANCNIGANSVSPTITTTNPSNSSSLPSGWAIVYSITAGSSYATINSSTGVITGKAAGSVTVKASLQFNSSEKASKTTTYTINAASISAFSYASAITIGSASAAPTVTATNCGSLTKSFAITAGSDYATINTSTGVVTGRKSGTVTVTVSYKNGSTTVVSKTANITVSTPTVSFSSTSAATINVGGTVTRAASGSSIGSTNVTSDSIVYSSSATAVATVNSSGVITGVTPGSATISATRTIVCDGKTTEVSTSTNVSVTVSTPSITQGNVTIAKGDSKTLSTATTNPSSGLTVTFALSGSPNGVTCTSAGVVTVAQNSSASSATVVATAKNSGNTTVATKNITVTIEAPAITVKDGSTTLDPSNPIYTTVGTNKTLSVQPNFSDSLTVKSSNTSVATVSISGSGSSRTLTITPVAKGTCKVSVSTNSGFTPTGASLAAFAQNTFGDSFLRKVKELGSVGAVETQTVQFTVNVAEADTNHYVYFSNGGNWSSPTIHAWGSSGDVANRQAMTKIGVNDLGQDVYAYKFTSAQWAKVQNIHFLSSASATWSDSSNSDNTHTFTGSELSHNGFYNDGTYDLTIVKPQVTLADKSIDMGGTETMTATVLTSGTPSTFNWSSGTTSVATTADTHTASNVVTGVAPGTSTITVKAYAEKPSGWTSIVTNGTADDFVAGTATATATVVAENKTVTFGAKKTDDGSTFTDLSGAVTAKYYDAAAEPEPDPGSGSSGSSGSGAGKYMWYNTNNSKDMGAATSAGEMIDLGNGTCYGSFTCAAGQNYDVIINNSSTKGSCLNSSTTVTGNQTWAKVENNGTTYWALDSYSAAVTIYVIYDPTANSVTFTTTNPASGSSSGGSSGGSSGSGTPTGSGTTMTSPASVPYGKVAEFTAEASKTVGSVTYYFAEWVDGSGNTLSTDLTYTVKVTAAQSVYARYYKVYKLSAFDSYTLNGSTVTFVTAPPKIITVKHGTETYLYTYDGTASTGNPDSPDGDKVAALAIGSGTYGQGNYIQYYVGDEITLYYSAMASSEIFKGVFYNNSANYYVAKPTAAQYVAHTHSATTTLYMNSSYYETVPSGLPTTTVDHDAHSIKFTGNQDYKNIDIEIANKRKVYFSDYTNAIIGSKNTDDYYYDGEALSVTGDQLTVKAAGSATQTNSITASNVKFYRADANGQPTGGQLSGFTVAYSSGSNAVTNSGTTASERYIIINGNMPSHDLYIDLGMTNSYTIKLGSKVMSDSFASKTRLAEVATITVKEGSTTKLTAPNNADVTSSSTSVNTGTALTLTSTFTGSWSDYYMFVGWYWGTDSAPDFEKGFISDKLSLSYTPKKGGTIWAVGTRSLYINGSKYITGKDNNWYGENDTLKNLPMSFDAETGRYYWEITDTMFAAAGSNYKTWKEENSSATTEYGRYHTGDDQNLYWYDTDDKYHGKSFFQIFDEETGWNRSIWDDITYFAVDTPANGPTYGKVYPPNGTYEEKQQNGQGFINFNETNYPGYSSPLRIYFDPSKSGNAKLTVEATKIYSDLYVSNGYTVGSTLKTSAVTVQPVVDGVVKTSGQTGYFSVGKGTKYTPDVEGEVYKYTPAKKNATVRITKTAGGSDKIVAFFIYDIVNKTVRAERDVKKSGSNYYIDLTLEGESQSLYIVPIVEEAGANVTITFDATQLNRAQWGDIVTAYAWYQNNGGAALGDYPGQPMIPSDDMTTWTTTFKGVKSNNELEGITFSNYVDGAHSWLGCSGVMGTVTYGGSGTQASPTSISIADGALIKQYNYIESGNYKEYSRANFKAQTYDYREPIALYDRFRGQDHVTISFSMKDGNSSLISWRHTDLTSHNIVTLEPNPEWGKLNWEYLTNAKGDKYIDMNGNTMKTKPTASFYVAAKGLVLYNNSSMTHVFYSGKQYDAVSGVTYGGHSGIGMNYAVQWYVYDAQGNYITNVLTAGIADMSSNNVDTYIGKVLEDKGYAVDGKSVAICYDKPRYMYGDAESGSGATGYNQKRINVGENFDAYRFTGQWNAVATNELVKVNVGVGMMTPSGEVLSTNPNHEGYGNATASYDTTKGNSVHVTDEDGNEAPFTASNGSFVRTAVRDASNSPVKLSADAQNFIGWYYYDANTGDFVKATYTSNDNFYPNYSNKDVTFYAMYRASAVYKYNYTGREGARTYSAAGNDLTEAELSNNSVINPASHEADIKFKLPVGIGVFKKDINFSETSYGSWSKNADPNGYILNISGFVTSLPKYILTAHYKDSSGELQTYATDEIVYNDSAVNLTSLCGGDITTLYGKKFLGWYEYDGGVVGDLISTQHNYGLRLTRFQDIIAVYDENNQALPSEDYWTAHIDENEVNKELTTSTTGVYYNDTIVRIRKGSVVTNTTEAGALPSGAKVGVLVVCDNKTNYAIDELPYSSLNTLVGAISSGQTRKTKSGYSVTNLNTTNVTQFNRTDLAVRADYKTSLGSKYCVYAYIYDGSSYRFSAASAVKTYE